MIRVNLYCIVGFPTSFHINQLPEVDRDGKLVKHIERTVSNIKVGHKGYGGYSLLTAIPGFPVYKCHSIDYMHGLTLGVYLK